MNRHERVTFYSPTPVSDGRGGQEEGWTEEFDATANFRFLRGSEAVIGARLEGKQPIILTIRNCSDARRVTTGWKAVDARRGTEYNIRSGHEDENRRDVVFMAESGVAV